MRMTHKKREIRHPALSGDRQTMIASLCRFIEQSDSQPTLAELADRAGISPYYLHRLFKEAVGVTPKAYAKAVQAGRLRENLTCGNTVTDSMYASGFSSGGQFYRQADELLGMTPTVWREGGAAMEIRYAVCPCSLGYLLAARTHRGVCAIFLGDNPEDLEEQLRESFPAAMHEDDAAFATTMKKIAAFVDAPRTTIDLPLDIRGTAFQRQVWQILREVPAGTTISYREIARRIGMPEKAGAVIRACAANTLAVVIPCHRAIRHGNNIAGYRWGTNRKKALLEAERNQSGDTRG